MPMEYVSSEARRMIEECLTQNEYIEGIEGFDCKVEHDKLICSFTIVTTFGEVEYNVAI